MSTSSPSWCPSVVIAVLIGLGLGAGAPPALAQVHDANHPAPLDTISVEAYQGWKQFELNCSRCHGEYGVGTSFAPALIVSLKDGGTIPTKEIFIQTVCAGRPDKGMPSWCALGLEMDKINNIYAYLKGRADGKIHAGRPAVKSDAGPGKSSS
jgi:mono/diheme cytochrome c family protein